MAWTQTDVDALKKAMQGGIKRVQYTSGSVEYHSMAEMKALLKDMEREVAGAAPVRRTVARFVSGY
ncbi:MAG TPA: hypothetical protein VGN60_00815 [Devosia sp.]|jgi:hypothetical protein|nr:hypothetical protein [Devosia sp.]